MKDDFVDRNVCKYLNCVHKYFGILQYSFIAPVGNNHYFEYSCINVGYTELKAFVMTAHYKMYDIYLDDATGRVSDFSNALLLPTNQELLKLNPILEK